jgi:peptidoglycan hydrolase-like protein with peptidoglycan-binding domain
MPVVREDHVDETAFRRSLRASRARRAAVARTRRRRLTGSRGLALALAGLAFATTGALAEDAGRSASGAQSDVVSAVQAKLGLAADGVYGPRTRAAVRRFQRRNGLMVDGIVGPQTLGALGISGGALTRAPATSSSAGAAASGSDAALLAAIARCESGGDPTAVSADGRYRGKYQFSRATWRAMGGSGDPAAASETEQDLRAATLLARQGRSAWPVCSRKAA